MLPEELAPALNCAQSTLEKLDLPAGVKVAIGVGPDRGNETPQPEAPAPHARRRLEKRDGYASKCQIRISLRPNAGFEYLNLRGIRLLDRTEQPIQVLESDISFGQQGIEAWANCFNGGPGCHSAMSPQDDYPWFSASFDCARGLTKITVLNREHDCCRNRINAYMLVLYGRAGTRIEQWYFDGGFPEYSFPVNVDYCTARIATRPGAWDSLHLREFAVEMYAPYQSNHKPPIIGHVSSNAEPFWNCYDGNLENFCHTTKWDPLPSATLQYWCGAVGTSNSGWSGVFVHLFNRIDCCSERIMNFQLELLDRGGVPLGPNHGIANSNAYIQFNQAYPWKRCGIHIFTKPGVPAEYLHLREVKIFARTGQVPANQLDYWMSSELPNDPVSRCFDGAEGPTASYCHTAGGDGNPSLTVRYDCAIDVDYVEIHNRVDCCKQRITNFALTFFDAFGAIRTPYDFQYAIDAFRISPWEPSWCSVRVVLKSGANPRSLALREMRLINEDGRALHVSELQIAISSEWPTLGVGYCFDGDMGTICVSKEDDKNPKLAVRYDCSRKKLQRVEVYNRIDCPAAWDCPGALNSYRLEFLDPTGSELRAPYDFEGGRGEYFVPAQYAMCTVQIRMNPGERSGEFLNLRQVKLFDQNGQIPSSELLTALAPDWPAEYPVGRCFDGSTALDNMCHTGSSTEASLTIRYNCAMRQLSRVEVFNRWDSCGALCADRLNKFQLEFLRPDGKPFRFPYHFAGGRQLYNVGEKCAIRFVPPSEKPELRLRELRLFGTDNALFPPSDLVFGADWRACFDGNDNTQCTIPASAADETYVVRYPCTKTVLTRVEVVPAEGDSSITRFQLEFLDAAMFPSREPSLFKTWKALYTITAGSTANIAAASDLEAEFNTGRAYSGGGKTRRRNPRQPPSRFREEQAGLADPEEGHRLSRRLLALRIQGAGRLLLLWGRLA
ncbi:hypothetical protein DFJ74DRAFT_321035 [Hyaloraphidium curvatum]|nr:hypothetical protein DFJ74DRAFT_321035 [Hyaloraphidium curvatum]